MTEVDDGGGGVGDENGVVDYEVVHCCTMSLSGIWVPRQMIITKNQISRKKIIEWATN